MPPFYTHKYTQLYDQYATNLDAEFSNILDNTPPNSKFKSKIFGEIAVFNIPLDSCDVQFHHTGSLCYLISALAICVVPTGITDMKTLFANKPDFLVARVSLWSDEDAIRDVIFINDEMPNCAHIKDVQSRLVKEALTQVPHHGLALSVDGYLDEDFPIQALLHLQRMLGCNPKS